MDTTNEIIATADEVIAGRICICHPIMVLTGRDASAAKDGCPMHCSLPSVTADSDHCICASIIQILDCSQEEAMAECPALLHRCEECYREIEPGDGHAC